MREFFLTTPANVFIMRGVEGEAVVRLHSPQPIEEMRYDGAPVTRFTLTHGSVTTTYDVEKAAARRVHGQVCRPDHALRAREVRPELVACPHVVAEGDDVSACGQ